MRDFRQIKVWVKAHSLTLEIYKATTQFPREELYGLTSQLRRSSASIPANIAEGFGRGGNAELARFLQIGLGSAYELEYHILLANDLGLVKRTLHEQTRTANRGSKTDARLTFGESAIRSLVFDRCLLGKRHSQLVNAAHWAFGCLLSAVCCLLLPRSI